MGRAMLQSQKLDWPTEAWRVVGDAMSQLNATHAQYAAIQAEKAKRHVRARRAEEVEDNFISAERHFLYMQQKLGLNSGGLAVAEVWEVLATTTAASACLLLALGHRMTARLPPEVWQLILSGVLPVAKLGFVSCGPVVDEDDRAAADDSLALVLKEVCKSGVGEGGCLYDLTPLVI